MLEFSSTESCTTSNTSTPLVGFSSNDSSCDGNVALMNDFESTGGCSGQGPQGPDGFSAYQIAVFNGFVGTEEEWLASLVGAPGPGVPVGGTAGQILTKIDSTNYNTFWQDNYADWTSVVKHIVKNDGTGLILKGTPVYVTGSNGTNMLVGKASNISEATSSKTMGLMQTDITTTGGTQTGFVITEGLLAGLNTAGRTAGEPIWLGPNGTLIYGLINKPYAPAHLVFIGIVTKVSAGNGEVFVKIQNGFELKEIHDVDVITTTPVNGDVLGFNGSLWVNKTIPNWLGYTPFNLPSLTSGSVLFSNGTTLAQDNANFFWDDTNNRLGIGTATPISTLDVNGQVSIRNGLNFFKATTNIVGSYNADASNYQDLLIKANSYDFSIGAVNKLFISSAGNVGIGTSTFVGSIKLAVNGQIGGPTYSSTYLDVTGAIPELRGNSGIGYYSSVGNHTFYGGSSVEYMRLTTAGLLGIGTNSPSEILHISGTTSADRSIRIDRDISSTNGQFYLKGITIGGSPALLIGSGNSISGNFTGISYMGGSNNVGIGMSTTIAPTSPLTVGRNITQTVASPYFFISSTSGLVYTQNTLSNGNTLSFISGETYWDGNAGMGNVRPLNILSIIRNTAGITMRAGYFSARTTNLGVGTFMSGVTGELVLSGTGAVTNAMGQEISLIQDGIKTTTNLYGIKVLDLTNSAGTITNTYGLYLGNLTAGTQTNAAYGIYQSSATDKNYFAGNVGIGTTTPLQKLDVVGTIRATTEASVLGNVTGGLIAQRTSNDSVLYFGFRTTPDAWVIGASYATTGAYKPIILATSDTARMAVLANGNVGIGTITPNTKAEVYGLETVNRTSYSDILTISAGANTNPYTGHGGGILFRATNYISGTTLVNSARIGSTITNNSVILTGADLFFDVSPLQDGVLSRAMTIKYNGAIGIGTTAPTAKLDILDTVLAGSAALAGSVLNIAQTWNTTGVPTAIKLNVTDTLSGAGSLLLDLQVGASSKFYVRNDGVVSVSNEIRNGSMTQTTSGLRYGNTASFMQLGGASGAGSFANSGSAEIDLYGITNVTNPGAIIFKTGVLSVSNQPEVARITSTGNLGIGNNAPTARLQVKGDGTNPIARFETSTSAISQQFYDTSMIGFGNVNPVYAGIYGHSSIDPNTASTSSLGVGLISNQSSTTASYGFGIRTTNGSNAAQWITGTGGLIKFITSGFIPSAAGNGNYRNLEINYSLNGTNGAQTGTATGIFLNATETALNGMVHNLMDLQVGSVSKFRVTNSGTAILSGLYVNGLSNSFINSTSNGTLVLYNSGGTDFNRIQLGGTTSSFPAIKRNGAGIDFRLADDSGFCAISAAQAVFTNTFVSILFSPSYYESTGVKQWLSVANTTAACSFKTTSLFADSGTINASARVQIDSTTQGFLPPRMTTAQKTGIVSPATGLVVFDTDLGKLCVFAVTWQTITSV